MIKTTQWTTTTERDLNVDKTIKTQTDINRNGQSDKERKKERKNE